jgi:hypothetical protein
MVFPFEKLPLFAQPAPRLKGQKRRMLALPFETRSECRVESPAKRRAFSNTNTRTSPIFNILCLAIRETQCLHPDRIERHKTRPDFSSAKHGSVAFPG